MKRGTVEGECCLRKKKKRAGEMRNGKRIFEIDKIKRKLIFHFFAINIKLNNSYIEPSFLFGLYVQV